MKKKKHTIIVIIFLPFFHKSISVHAVNVKRYKTNQKLNKANVLHWTSDLKRKKANAIEPRNIFVWRERERERNTKFKRSDKSKVRVRFHQINNITYLKR